MVNQITYDGFVELIERMANRKESGSLYVRTDSNRSVLVGLLDGKIEALVAGPKRGMEAIKTIMQMTHCSCRRDNNALPYQSKDLPSTNDILLLLKQRNTPPAAQETSAGPSAGTEIDSEYAVKILCKILHDYVGPAAVVICEDVTENGAKIHSGADLAETIEELALEIDSISEAAEFLNRARTDLKEYIY